MPLVSLSCVLLLQQSDDPAAILLLIAVALLVLFFFLKASADLPKLAAQAETARKQGRTAEAEKLLRRIARIEPGFSKKQLSEPQKEANRKIFAQAFLTLGEICEKKNARSEAFGHYRKARQLGAPLTSAAWAVLAEGYADRQSKSDNALGAYFAYIHEHPLDTASAKVYSALEAACQVDEGKKSAERKQAIELNQRVLAANSNLEWPYYYMAVAYLLDGNVPAAMTNLTQAQKLNPNRAMTYYWMGACHLQQAGGANLLGAVDSLNRFLAFPQESPQVVKRQGKAAFELAKKLIETIGGFDTTADCTLDQAIQYLEIAVSRDDSAAPYHFFLGRAYSLRKNTDRALTALRRAVSLGTGEKEYPYFLGVEYFKAGMLEESRDALRQALAADANYADAHEWLAQVCLRTARYDEAETHARAVAAERRDRVEACLWQALYQQSKFQEVIVESSAARRGHTTEAMYWLARCYSQLREFQPALEILQGQPNEPRAAYYAGCALAGLGRFDEAQTRFQETGGEYRFQAQLQRGHIFLRSGNLAAAGDSYDTALAAQPRNVEALYAMGNLAFRMGEMDVAAGHFSTILADQPDNTGAQYALGVVSEARGQIADAIQRYESASAKMSQQGLRVRLGVLYSRSGRHADSARILEPLYRAGVEQDAVLFYLGMALISLDRPAEAEEVWSKLLRRNPQDRDLAAGLSRVRYILGQQCARRDDYAGAIAQWEKYLEQFPSDDETSSDLAELYLRQALRRLASPEAEALLDRALARDVNNPRCGYYRALHFLKLKKFDECAAQLRATLEQSGEASRVRYHLGLCLLLKGDSEEGLRQLQAVAGNGYGRYAAWAIANEHVRQARYEAAEAALAGAV